HGVVDANVPVIHIRLDPRRVPVFLAAVVDGVHHEGVDVADPQLVIGQAIADGLLLLGQQVGRPGMRHIGHDLDAGVADPCQATGSLGEGVFEVSVGAEGEVHYTGQ